VKKQPAKWQKTPLRHLCEVSRAIIDPADLGGNEQYVGLEHIDGDSGDLTPVTAKQADIISSKFRFCSTDILFGKLRPYLRKTARPEFSGVCSTDILPLKPNPARIDKDLLYYLLRRPDFVAQVTARTSGANLPRISPDTLLSFEVCFPIELTEQRRIVAVLELCASMNRKRREALRLADEFLRSVFLEMFGDPNFSSRVCVARLGDLADVLSGATPSRSEPDFWNGDYPWVSPKDMKRLEIADSEEHISEKVFADSKLKRVPQHSVLVVVRGMILAHSFPVAITMREVAINQDMKALVPRPNILPTFLLWALAVQRGHMLTKVSTAAHGTKRLEMRELLEARIPLPSIEKQREFVTIASAFSDLRRRQVDAQADADALFQSLSQRAFRGEL